MDYTTTPIVPLDLLEETLHHRLADSLPGAYLPPVFVPQDHDRLSIVRELQEAVKGLIRFCREDLGHDIPRVQLEPNGRLGILNLCCDGMHGAFLIRRADFIDGTCKVHPAWRIELLSLGWLAGVLFPQDEEEEL